MCRSGLGQNRYALSDYSHHSPASWLSCTDMGGPGAQLEISFSVEQILKVATSATPADSGTFKKYDGTTLPW